MFVVSVRERGKEEHKFTFRKEKITVGRLRANDIILPKRNISKKHAQIAEGPDAAVLLSDLGSTNGSFINGKRIMEEVQVAPEDKVFMGDYILQIEVMSDKSAIEDAGMTDLGGLDVEGDAPEKPTVAEIDSDLLEEELQRLGLPGEDEEAAGPATVVVDPSEVPSELPPDLESPEADVPGPQTATGLKAADPNAEETDAMTLRVKDLPEDLEEPEEELIDIPLLEEELEPEPAPEPAPEPEPVPEPEPSPAPPVEPLEPPQEAVPEPAVVKPPPSITGVIKPFVPETAPEPSVREKLGREYARFAFDFDEWAAGAGDVNEGQALDFVSRQLAPALKNEAGPEIIDQVSRQVVGELTGLGAIATLLDNGKVGEIFVAPSGRLIAYDWRGGIVDTDASLSCPAATERLADRLAADAGGPETEGFLETRLPDGTAVRVLSSPFAAEEPGIRFVKSFQTELSLKTLVESGVGNGDQVSRLQQALDGQRSIIIVGRESQTNAIVVSSMTASIPAHRKVLVCGDRFSGSAAGEHFLLFNATALTSPNFADAISVMDCHWVAADNCGGEAACAVLKLGAVHQVPFILSMRMNSPGNTFATLRAAAGEPDKFSQYINTVGPVVVSTRRDADGVDRIEGLYLFSTHGDHGKLVPVTG